MNRPSRLSIITASALVICFVVAAMGQQVSQSVTNIVATTCAASNWARVIAATGAATCSQPANTDITGLGTASTVNTGTSGATIPLLSGTNTWGAAQTVNGTLTANLGRIVARANSEVFGIQFENRTGDGQYYIGASHAAGPDLVFSNKDGTERMRLTDLGALTIPAIANAATTSAVCVTVATGLLSYDGTLGTCTVSLLAAKNLTAPLTPKEGYDIVMALDPWRYTMKEGLPTFVAGEQIGFVADYAANLEVAQSVVAYNHDGTLAGFRYENYTAALTAAFKYNNDRITKLEADNDNLRVELRRLSR